MATEGILGLLTRFELDVASNDYVPNYFNNPVTIFVSSFIPSDEGLPIINFRPVLTRALVDAVITCWFKLNSHIEMFDIKGGSGEQRQLRVLNIDKDTKTVYEHFGFILTDEIGQALHNVKKLIWNDIVQFKVIYEDEDERSNAFTDLLDLTSLILRSCDIKLVNKFLKIRTHRDIEMLKNKVTQFSNKVELRSPFHPILKGISF